MSQLTMVSVITVCLNSRQTIERTIRSVTEQSLPNIEYIVIDGASNDGTIDLIEKHESKISFSISEEDKGLYFAMNKAIDKATGEYICFINAGDRFYNSDTLSNLNLTLNGDDLVFGDTMLIDQNNNELGLRSVLTTHSLPDTISLHELKYGLPCSHQSIMVRREICPHYDTRYIIGADYDWILNLTKKARSTRSVKFPISAFETEGLSSRFWRRSLFERFLIQMRHYGCLASIRNHLYITIRGVIQALRGKRLR